MTKLISDISVLISTKDRYKSTLDCFKSITNQSRLPYSVIVVEDISNQQIFSKQHLQKFFHPSIHCQYIKANKVTLAKSRNIAIKASKTNLNLFVDDDVILDSDYLKNLHALYKKYPKKTCIVGKILSKKNNYWQTFSKNIFMSQIKNHNNSILYWPTLNLSFQKQFLLKNNLKFDESNNGALEDIDFCISLKKAKGSIYYSDKLIVIHDFRDNIVDFIRTFFYYFQSIAFLQKKHNKKVSKVFNLLEIIHIKNSHPIKKIWYLPYSLIKLSFMQNHYLQLSPKYIFASMIYYSTLYISYQQVKQ